MSRWATVLIAPWPFFWTDRPDEEDWKHAYEITIDKEGDVKAQIDAGVEARVESYLREDDWGHYEGKERTDALIRLFARNWCMTWMRWRDGR